MSVTSLTRFKELGVVYIFFEFLVLCNDTKNVFIGEVVPSRAKKQQRVGIKPFHSNTSYGLEYEKTALVNYLLKCS